jgi:hypothetical protein
MKNILICTHYNKIQGLTDIFLNYCLSNEELETIVLLRNPLSKNDKLKSQIIVYKKSKKIDEINFFSLSYFQFFTIWILNLYYLKKVKTKYRINHFNYCFAFDPLQYFYLFFYRFFIKISKKIFYSSDYADKRFNNRFNNFLYKFIDRLSLRDCDLYVAPSEVILQIREKQRKNKEQLYLVPHSFDSQNVIVRKIKERIPFSMVFIGNIKSPSVDLKYIFDGIADLKKIKYPEIKLYIFGDGNLVPEYKSYVAKLDIANNVLFLGIRPHDELFRDLGRYWIGLCPYTVGLEIQGWHTTYCSLFTTKMIEYIANGTPFLTTALHDNVNLFEKWKVGRVMAPAKDSFMQNIDFFFSDRVKLDEYSNSCYEKSKDYSSEIVYGKLFEKLKEQYNHQNDKTKN